MPSELQMNKVNRLLLADAFRSCRRVDVSIECAIEGQMGRLYVDDPAHPRAFCLRVGPFGYFAGSPRGAAGRDLMEAFPQYHLLMPSTDGWVDLAAEVFAGVLQSFPRYSFSAAALSRDHLAGLLAASPFNGRVVPLSLDLILSPGCTHDLLDLSDYDSPTDFLQRGLGFTVLVDGKMAGSAYSSLVCSQGIEVRLFVEEACRRQGMATALASALLLACLERGLRPNWDAANPESVKLASKLGYAFLDSYDAYYHS